MAGAAEGQRRQAPPFASGVALAVELGPGVTKVVSHGLGYVPRGFIVIDALGAAVIDSTAKTSKTITMRNSGGGTVKITVWVY